MERTREQLVARVRESFVPGHGPDVEKMTDEQLNKSINMMESAFEMAFEEEE